MILTLFAFLDEFAFGKIILLDKLAIKDNSCIQYLPIIMGRIFKKIRKYSSRRQIAIARERFKDGGMLAIFLMLKRDS